MHKLLPLLILSIIAFSTEKTSASHVAGAELRYEYLGSNVYRFHFILYRDCNGIPVNTNYQIDASSVCGNSMQITVDTDSVVNVSQMCAGAVDKCINFSSPYMGIEAWYYHGDTTIAAPCSLWTFGINPICDRNAAITNILSPSATCLYVETKLNNASVPSNSSPVFSALPLFHLCDEVQYLHLYAHDPDGDSLAFEMYTPHSDATTDVYYINGLSSTQPVTYANANDSTRFYPLTGDIRFYADDPQITVVAVRVNEFRNGIFIGSEERDIEVIFSNCTGNSSTASGINGTSSFTSHICVDSLFTFHVNTNDFDGDSVRISYINNIPGSTITLSGVNMQIVNFTWQPPDTSYISDDPYTLILYVTDSVCPYVYFNSYVYNIYVDSCNAITGVFDVMSSILSFNASYSSLSGSIIFNFSFDESEASTVSLYDITGRKIDVISIEKSIRGLHQIKSPGISPGLYLLNLKTESGKNATVKVMVE